MAAASHPGTASAARAVLQTAASRPAATRRAAVVWGACILAAIPSALASAISSATSAIRAASAFRLCALAAILPARASAAAMTAALLASHLAAAPPPARSAALWLPASGLAAAPPPARSAVLRLPAWLSLEAPSPPRFVATVDGQDARVLSVKGPDEDLMLLLVLDLTGDLSLVEPARRALVSEIGALPPRTWVALLKSQDGLQVAADPTPDRASITDLVEKLPSTGRPGLLDTIEEAARLGDSILARAQVRLAVLYVTDSDVRGYREDFTNPVINSSDSHDLSRRFPAVLVREKISKLDDKLAARQTPCFIVHLDYRSDRLNEAYQIGLKQLAETTGGTATFARSLAEVPENLHAVFASIGSHSSVSLELPKNVRRAFQVRLSLAGGDGGQVAHRTRFLRGKE